MARYTISNTHNLTNPTGLGVYTSVASVFTCTSINTEYDNVNNTTRL